jgi:hypothetical protein
MYWLNRALSGRGELPAYWGMSISSIQSCRKSELVQCLAVLKVQEKKAVALLRIGDAKNA